MPFEIHCVDSIGLRHRRSARRTFTVVFFFFLKKFSCIVSEQNPDNRPTYYIIGWLAKCQSRFKLGPSIRSKFRQPARWCTDAAAAVTDAGETKECPRRLPQVVDLVQLRHHEAFPALSSSAMALLPMNSTRIAPTPHPTVAAHNTFLVSL
jgi:hypothetical protein